MVTVDDEGAADIARLVAAVRGPGESRPGAAECRTITAAFMTDLYEARLQRSRHIMACKAPAAFTSSYRGYAVKQPWLMISQRVADHIALMIATCAA